MDDSEFTGVVIKADCRRSTVGMVLRPPGNRSARYMVKDPGEQGSVQDELAKQAGQRTARAAERRDQFGALSRPAIKALGSSQQP